MSISPVSGSAGSESWSARSAAARLEASSRLAMAKAHLIESGDSSASAGASQAADADRMQADAQSLRAIAASMFVPVIADTYVATSMSDMARSQSNFQMLAATYSTSVQDGGEATEALKRLML